MLALIHEVFTHSTSCIWRDVLQRCNIGCCSGNYDCVIHCTFIIQCLYQLCYSGLFLSDSYIDTDNIFAFLVDNGIDSDCCFTCLSVADDKFSLTFTDRDHRIDSLDTCLQRFMYRFSLQYARRRILDLSVIFRLDRPLAVDRLTQRIYNAADHFLPNRNFYNSSCRLYDVTFFDFFIRAENNCTDIIFFQIQRHAVYFSREFQQFASHTFFEAIYSGNPVTYLNYCTKIRNLKSVFVIFYLFFNDSTNFLRS